MKTETPPTPTPTIAELWGEFQKTFKHKPAMYLRHAANKGIEVTRYAKPIADAAIKYKSLRQQLLERCAPWITWNSDGSINARISFVPSNADAETLRKCAAICEFAAWELEQRQREKEAKSEN